ncbi:transketolase [Bradyrhizobium sp. F1.4.3]|uniref:transketolase n=1 Tax=Bradyrhizobium sp. F1.4.3 TaxID=3156356 RepID=UPI003395682F
MSLSAKSAHFGSSLSCVELLDAVLAASDIRADSVERNDRDRIVVSKGHAAMAVYATYEAWGLVPADAIENYLKDKSDLWGHVTRTPLCPAIDASTGSLGHGLGQAAGRALGARLRGWKHRTFCVLSDGECDEGSTWEAILFSAHYKLENLTALVDFNKIQSIGSVSDVMELEPFAEKWRSFGWHATELDGHDHASLLNALEMRPQKPHVIIAHTVKGKGVPHIEGTVGSHYIPATAADLALLKAAEASCASP